MDDSLKGTIRALKWVDGEAERLGIEVKTQPKKKKSSKSKKEISSLVGL